MEFAKMAADAVPSNWNEIVGAIVTLVTAIVMAFRKGRKSADK